MHPQPESRAPPSFPCCQGRVPGVWWLCVVAVGSRDNRVPVASVDSAEPFCKFGSVWFEVYVSHGLARRTGKTLPPAWAAGGIS